MKFQISWADPVKELEKKVKENPYFPFNRVGDQKFLLQQSYVELYIALGVLVVSSLFLIISASLKQYILDGDKKTCTFKVGREMVIVNYHNIYIRLRKSESQFSSKELYGLMFDGYRIDSHPITIRPSHRTNAKLRELGKKIAKNLNINYFDPTNMSKHHVLRHQRRSEFVRDAEEDQIV
ncbi:Protein of unknown function DUF4579 like protein [Aduncisulcus paluster]|uniref:Uncharacterized protein n=1 Tax=Aduncisulcus paluster TaxID=2918883 RepID=A0ABQ5K113_9EUKA|nr:Protein of unknown function DUF4579 like protein [Aduncisulcus paluster]